MKSYKSFVLLILITFCTQFVVAEKCKDFMLLDGSENLVRFGMDTTDNWWAITSPFDSRYKMVINGEISDTYNQLTLPVFSNSGLNYAFWGLNYNSWELITKDTILSFTNAEPGEAYYSADDNHLIYSYYEQNIEHIFLPDGKIEVMNKKSKLYTSYDAKNWAFTAETGIGSEIININGKASTTFSKIEPLGFWYDNEMLYAAFNGTYWQIYKNFEPFSESYTSIYEMKINREGTVFAFIGTYNNGYQVAVLMSSAFYEPLISSMYERISDLILHPNAPIIVYRAYEREKNIVMMNNTGYYAGLYSSYPIFSFDGNEMLYLACDIDCNYVLNGQRFPTYNKLDINTPYCFKPYSKTVAITTNSTMYIRNLENNELFSGMMADQMSPPRYNRFQNQYEALGVINNRLYLLTCKW